VSDPDTIDVKPPTAEASAAVPPPTDAEKAAEAAAEDAPQEAPPEFVWAQGFLMAVRAFANERKAEQVHITVTLANGERVPVMSVGPGGPPGFVGFGVETEGLREKIQASEESIPSSQGMYVPIGSIAKIEFSSEAEEQHALGFHVDRELDEA